MLGLIGFATRVAYTLPTISRPHGDSFFYRGVAQQLADGNGYADPFSALVGNPQPTAQHPPLFSMYLALWTKLGVSDFRAYQIVCCLLGAATVVLIGLLGRQLAGPGPGLIAAGIAALYPPLAVLDSTVNSESLYVPLVVVVLLLAYRYIARPNIGGAVALGLATGLATITRTDGILLLALVAAPVCWRFGRPRAPALAACAAAALLIVTPWIVRNWIQFDRVPLASSNGGHTLMATNCNSTYYDSDSIGFVSYDCGAATRCSQRLGELALSDCWGEEGRTYIDAHLGRLPPWRWSGSPAYGSSTGLRTASTTAGSSGPGRGVRRRWACSSTRCSSRSLWRDCSCCGSAACPCSLCWPRSPSSASWRPAPSASRASVSRRSRR